MNSPMSAFTKKRKIGKIILFLLSLGAGVLIFVCLLQAKQSALSDYQTKRALIARENIAKKTLINKDELNKYFEEAEVNAAYSVQGFSSIEELKKWMGRQDSIMAMSELRAKEQVYDNKFFCMERLEAELENPVEFCLKVDSYEYSVGGILRAGDLIDVLIVNPNNESEMLLENVLIIKAFDLNGDEIAADNKEMASIAFNVLVEKEQLPDLNMMLEQGNARLIKKFGQEAYD